MNNHYFNLMQYDTTTSILYPLYWQPIPVAPQRLRDSVPESQPQRVRELHLELSFIYLYDGTARQRLLSRMCVPSQVRKIDKTTINLNKNKTKENEIEYQESVQDMG